MTRRPNEGEPLELTNDQRQRARAALRAIEERIATTPQNLINDWKAKPQWSELRSMSNAEDEEFTDVTERWVSVSDISGISRDLVGEFMEGRMKHALQLLANDEFQPKYPHGKLHYLDICGDLYVTTDGSHRSMACKTVGVNEVYARVEQVNVDDTEYQEWEDRHDGNDRPASTSTTDDRHHNPGPEYCGPIQRLHNWLGNRQ
jgi:hypothetical protein